MQDTYVSIFLTKISSPTSTQTTFMKINIKKTGYMYQPVNLLHLPPEPELVNVNKEQLFQASDFTQLESTVSSSARLDTELQALKCKASAAFGKLQRRLWGNKHISIRAKCKVYRAIGLSSHLWSRKLDNI